MKKLMILAAGFITLSTAANAQVRFGIEGGLNLANMHTKVDMGSYTDKQDGELKYVPKAGFLADLKICNHFSLQPGVFYNMKGYKRDYTMKGAVAGTSIKAEDNTTLTYVEIPVNLQYQVMGPHFFVGAGPYIAMCVDGHNKFERTTTVEGGGSTYEEGKHELRLGNDQANSELRRTDYGVNMNVGYMMNCGLFFRANYGLGLANISPYDNTNTKNSVATISAGYFFGGRK